MENSKTPILYNGKRLKCRKNCKFQTYVLSKGFLLFYVHLTKYPSKRDQLKSIRNNNKSGKHSSINQAWLSEENPGGANNTLSV